MPNLLLIFVNLIIIFMRFHMVGDCLTNCSNRSDDIMVILASVRLRGTGHHVYIKNWSLELPSICS